MTLSDLITSICRYAGVDQVDVSDVPNVSIEGYLQDDVMTPAELLAPLLVLHDIMVEPLEEKLVFRQRAKSVRIITIKDEDTIGGIEVERTAEKDLPSELTLSYIHPTTFRTEVVRAQRPSSKKTSVEKIEVYVAMGRETAQEIIDRMLQDRWTRRTTARFRLLPENMELNSGDVVRLEPLVGEPSNFEIIQATLGADYSLEIEAVSAPEIIEVVIRTRYIVITDDAGNILTDDAGDYLTLDKAA